MEIRFVVPGDPVPYLRMTKRQLLLLKRPISRLTDSQFRKVKRIRRYFAFKDLVRIFCQHQLDDRPQEKVYLDVMIYFRKKNHADPENIRKAIQDALFSQDKIVTGAFDFEYTAGEARCEVVIQYGGKERNSG